MPKKDSSKQSKKYVAGLSLAALGIVYGDIGTSPLYAFQDSFENFSSLHPTPDNILGILSLIFWSLALVISFKYLTFVLRADNDGEGGIIALTALISPRNDRDRNSKIRAWMVIAGLFGASLLYGDSMVTPAISVVSAIGGLQVASVSLSHDTVIIITIAILVCLFFSQSLGSGGLGKIFGPITSIWFITLAILGVHQIIQSPEVFRALNPYYAIDFIARNGMAGFLVLGSVFLVVTGGEALYADIGHFGLFPIRITWFSIVLPSLVINYFGQGALLLNHPEAVKNPFFLMTPNWALYPVVIIATMATIIASQAVISGAFSLTRQAIQLGFAPRMKIEQTSTKEVGQVYLPAINWVMMIICIALVYGFGSSRHLAAAYGVGVSLDMVITGILFGVVTQIRWKWSLPATLSLIALFLVVDLSFFGANVVKIPDGGWFPLVVASIIITLMTTWKKGREVLARQMKTHELPLETFLKNIGEHAEVTENKIKKVEGTAVYMTSNPTATPPALLHNIKHNKVIHDKVIILSVNNTEEKPYVSPEDRFKVNSLGKGFYTIVIQNGFAQNINIPTLLKQLDEPNFKINMADMTFFLGKERILPSSKKTSEMAAWRDRLFGVMVRNQQPATAYFGLPANRVVEIGSQIKM